MQSFRFGWVLASALWVGGAAVAQSGSIVQDEHDKRVKADSDRATQYHNNADDYPASKGSAPNVPTPPARIPLTRKEQLYVDPASEERERGREARNEEKRKELAASEGAVKAGNADAIYDAAIASELGFGTRVDLARAVALYLQIANQSDYSAFKAGQILFSGSARWTGMSNDSVPRDEETGRKWIHVAATHGYADAVKWEKEMPVQHRHLGEFPAMTNYSESVFQQLGKGVQPAPPVSEKLIKQKTEQLAKHCCVDLNKDMEHIGEILAAGKASLFGVGVPADPARALALLTLANKGHAVEACDYLGWAQLKAAEVPSRAGEAMSNIMAFEKCGVARPMAAYERALSAQLLGDAEGQRSDLGLAVQAAGDNRSPLVLQIFADLGVMELEGAGGNVDEKGGLALLHKAADGGNRNAQYVLGVVYDKGLHGEMQDRKLAGELFAKAAQAGQPDAQKSLLQVGMAKP